MTTLTRRLPLGLLLGLAGCTPWVADKTFDQHFSAPPGGQLTLETDIGSVTIVGHDSRDLVVHAVISGTYTNRIRVTAEQTPSGVTVIGRASRDWFPFSIFNERVQFTIDVPRDYPVNLRTSGGRIEVRDLNAGARGSTSGGRIEIRDVTGSVAMHTSGGRIDAADIHGSIQLRSSGGSIEVTNAIGDLDVSTSGGRIDLTSIDGKMRANTSGGRVHVEARANHSITLSTSSGSISLLLPEDVRASIDAETTAGRVTTQFPLSRTELNESSHVRGDINGGGEPIWLRTAGGSIEIASLGIH